VKPLKYLCSYFEVIFLRAVKSYDMGLYFCSEGRRVAYFYHKNTSPSPGFNLQALGLVASTLLHQHGDWQTCDFSTNLKQTQQ
jgi:hypothetical protein